MYYNKGYIYVSFDELQKLNKSVLSLLIPNQRDQVAENLVKHYNSQYDTSYKYVNVYGIRDGHVIIKV